MEKLIWFVVFLSAPFVATSLQAGGTFSFSTGNPDGILATASRPESPGKFEIESADDFVLTDPTQTVINSATFTGLIPTGFPLNDIHEIRVEIYRVFPFDSNVGRTSGPPTFSTPQVPTRVNSPGDVALTDRESDVPNSLSFTTTLLNSSFTAANSIQPGGIHPIPNQLTFGNGPVTGQEVQFNVNFISPLALGPGHYFFVPQVYLGAVGDFLWLSTPKPIVPPGTPFSPDLQAWTRDANLDPDWLREGTDITGGPPVNEAFTLSGTVPDTGSTALLLGSALGVLFYLKRRMGCLRHLTGDWGQSPLPRARNR